MRERQHPPCLLDWRPPYSLMSVDAHPVSGGSASYRPDIDGLRALAVVAVVAFHAFPAMAPGGFIGVDVFFVISGFLITGTILDSLRRQEFSFGDFFGRRIRRIFPALIVVLAAVLGLGWKALLADEYLRLGRHAAAGAGFLQNFQLMSESGYFDASATQKPLLHLWSLSIEEQFYVMWPLLVWLFWHTRIPVVMLTVCVMVASFWFNLSLMTDAAVMGFYSPFSRVWELALGATLAAVAAPAAEPSRERPVIRDVCAALGLALILLASVRLTSTRSYPGWAALLPTIGTGLLLRAGGDTWLARHLLSSRGLVWIGLISYPLYLWHWPLLSLLAIVSAESAAWEHRLLTVLVSVLLAALTYACVERPLRRLPVSLHRSLTAVALLASMGIAGAMVVRADGYPHRLQAFEEQVAAIRAVVESDAGCRAMVPIAGARYCRLSTADVPPTVALFGDSHANSLFAPLAKRFGAVGENLLVLGGGGCVPFWDFETGVVGEPNGCDRQMRPQLEYLVETPSITTVILAHRGAVHVEGRDLTRPNEMILRDGNDTSDRPKPDLYRRGLEQAVRRFQAAGKRVVLLLDAPEFTYDPTACLDLARPYGSPFVRRPSCRLPWTDVEARNRRYEAITRDVARTLGGVAVIDLKAALCSTDSCDGVHDGQLLYRDADHLSTLGAEYVIERLWPGDFLSKKQQTGR